MTSLLVLPASALAQGRGDDWLGVDKAKHFGVSAGLASGGYLAGALFLDARGHALLFGGAVAFGAGATKELLDLAGAGDPSWKDLAWDAIGTVAGLAFAWAVDLLSRGISTQHPLFVTPTAHRDSVVLRANVRF